MERFYRFRTKAVLACFLIFLSAVTAAAALREVTDAASFMQVDSQVQTKECFSDGSTLTVLMYHNVLKEGKKQSTYCIGEDALKRDFEYLRKNNFNILSCAEVIDRVYAGKRLPDKAVMITFDDGYLNNVKYALPLLKEYGYTALFSVVGDYTLLDKNNPKVGGDFVYLGWKDIKQASQSKNIEIGLHSYSMHYLRPRLGVAQLKGESDKEYSRVFADDTDKLIKSLYNAEVQGRFYEIYAYPYGKYNSISERILKEKGIKMTLTCNEGINSVSSPEDLYLLKRLNRDATKESLEDIFAPYDKLAASGK